MDLSFVLLFWIFSQFFELLSYLFIKFFELLFYLLIKFYEFIYTFIKFYKFFYAYIGCEETQINSNQVIFYIFYTINDIIHKSLQSGAYRHHIYILAERNKKVYTNHQYLVVVFLCRKLRKRLRLWAQKTLNGLKSVRRIQSGTKSMLIMTAFQYVTARMANLSTRLQNMDIILLYSYCGISAAMWIWCSE